VRRAALRAPQFTRAARRWPLLTIGKFTLPRIVPPASHITMSFLPGAAASTSALKVALESMGDTPLKE
jgi:hypothetical protein